jgi:glycosyltransferase involved in cell wall biosynthesis
MTSIALNARFFSHRPTGMQRYAIELSRRFAEHLDPVAPVRSLTGLSGHLWEQVFLPSAVKGRLLWSPNNTGPLAVGRQVCTIHDLIPLDHPEWFGARFARWYAWLLPRLARRVEHIIAVSEFTKTRIVDRLKVPPAKVTVIPNGVDSRFYRRSPVEIEVVRKRLSIPTPEYLLSVGSLEPRKNLPRLLAAWAKAQDSVPNDIWLVVAGARGNRRVFANCEIDSIPPRVHFTGYVEDEFLPSLYSGALALVYPSLYEGFGLPPLESMACGVPVVTSNGTSLPEVVGDTAILIHPGNVDSIVEGMLEMIARRRGSATCDWSQTAIDRAREYSWDGAARRTLKVLLEHA